MRFAIDGPIVITFAPFGTWCLIHWPASRPPGTPPAPASSAPPSDGWMRSRLATTRESAITPAATGDSQRRAAGEKGAGSLGGLQPVSVLAARIATTGAAGSRYWNPFTGQTWKKITGTAIHESSR